MFVPSLDHAVPLTLHAGVPYGEVGGVRLLLDLVLPQQAAAQRAPAALMVHGGGWFAGTRADVVTYWCAQLAAHGIVAASVDYRLSAEATFPAQIHDVKAAIRWLRANADTYGIDPNRVGIWGHSAGGHLAALAALTGDLAGLEGSCGTPGVSSRVQAVAIASAPSDFLSPGAEMVNDDPSAEHPVTQLFGGTVAERAELMRLASPITHAHPDAPPFLITHGTLDETVPFGQARTLHRALVAAEVPVEFVPIDGGYHNLNLDPERCPPIGPPELAPMTLRFFQQHLCR